MNLPKAYFGPSPANVCEMFKGIKFLDAGKIVATVQFYGFAVSSDNRLEFGSNKWTRAVPGESTETLPRLWDGFVSIPFAPRPGFDFWYAFRLTVMPKPNWEIGSKECAALDPSGALPQAALAAEGLKKTTKLEVKMTVETYVDGGGAGAGTEPCVLVTIPSIRLKITSFQFDIGRGMGGWCQNNDAATDRCSPGGFFLNLETTFVPKSYQARFPFKALMFGMEEADEEDDGEEFDYWTGGDLTEPFSLDGGWSFGVFLDSETDALKAVVFRIEMPSIQFFGIQMVAGPKFHFQYFVGSEMERRRESILRIGSNANCPTTVSGCESWKPYVHYEENDSGDFVDLYDGLAEICEDQLYELDLFNLVMIAQSVDPKRNGDINRGGVNAPRRLDGDADIYYANPRFDYRNAPDSDVFLISGSLPSWGMIIVSIEEIQFTVSYAERTETVDRGDCIPEGIDGWNANDAEDILECLSDLEDDNERQDLYGYIYAYIRVLFLLRVEVSLAFYNNPELDDNFWDWRMEFFLSGTLGRLVNFKLSGKTDPFFWDDLRRTRELEEATDESTRRHLRQLQAEPNWNLDLDYSFNFDALIQFLNNIASFMSGLFYGLYQGWLAFVDLQFELLNVVLDWIPDFVSDFKQALFDSFDLDFDDPQSLIISALSFQGISWSALSTGLAPTVWKSFGRLGRDLGNTLDVGIGSILSSACDEIPGLGNACGSCNRWMETRVAVRIPGDCSVIPGHPVCILNIKGIRVCQESCKAWLDLADQDSSSFEEEYYKKCWCMPDEYGCAVTVLEARGCAKFRSVSSFGSCGNKKCGDWELLPIDHEDDDELFYPLFASRTNGDQVCRDNRKQKTERAERILEEIGGALGMSGDVWGNKIQGLNEDNLGLLNFEVVNLTGSVHLDTTILSQESANSTSIYEGPIISNNGAQPDYRSETTR